jgi:hypothetical protein
MAVQQAKTMSPTEAMSRLASVRAKLMRQEQGRRIYQTPSGAWIQLVPADNGQVKLIASRGCDC